MGVIEDARLKQIGLDAIEAAKMQKVAKAAHAQGMTAGARGLANLWAEQLANSNPQVSAPNTNTNNVGSSLQGPVVVNGKTFVPNENSGLAATSNRWYE